VAEIDWLIEQIKAADWPAGKSYPLRGVYDNLLFFSVADSDSDHFFTSLSKALAKLEEVGLITITLFGGRHYYRRTNVLEKLADLASPGEDRQGTARSG